ncbi:MAG: PAS domain-containing protein [Deltaproteobacteria bacterium]|nr:PAS domain-containing protein [Deltaproteobacteria bacterium]
MGKKKRLIWCLYPSYLLIILISITAVTWFASIKTRQFFLENTESDLKSRAILFESRIASLLDPLDSKGLDQLCKEAGKRSSTRLTVILPSGEVAGDSEADPATMDNHSDRVEFINASTGEYGISIRTSLTLSRDFMYLGIPVRKEGKLLAIVRTSIPLDVIDTAIKGIQKKIIFGALIIILLGAVISLIVSRRISRPIEQLKEEAEYYIRGDFNYRVPISDIEEIGSLNESMRNMAQQLHARINTITQQRTEIEAILSSMIEGVIAVDSEERIIIMNEAAGRMFGCNPSAVQGHSIQEAVRNTHLQQFISETLSDNKPVEKEIGLVSEEERYISGHGTMIRNIEGKGLGALFVLSDITKLRRLENIRKDFVANVSHEIKTPITAIKGFVEILRDDTSKDENDIKRFLDIIAKHVNRLEAIIDDLLKLSRIEKDAETEGIQFAESEIKDVLESAVQAVKPLAGSKGTEINLSCNDKLTARINPPLLEQAVINLLDNAIKYSDEKKPVKIEALPDEKEVVIHVTDNGRGIEQQHLSRIFERFYRVDKARSRSLGGTGLGLSIVKHIIQAHGGHISVTSTPGKGSTFTIHLPR